MNIPSISRFGDGASSQQLAFPKGATASAAAQPDALKLQAAPQQTTGPTPAEILDAVQALKKKVELVTPGGFEISIDEEARMTVVRITDGKTGEMIRQIPAPELVELAKDLDRMQGLLLRQQA